MNTIENGQELAKIDTDLSNKVTFPTVDLNIFTMDDLEEADVMPVELTSVYWTPEKVNESLRVIFLGIEKVPMRPLGTEDKSLLNEDGMVMLPCAFFLTSGEDRVVKICNASKRLVSTLQGSFIKPMTPLLVEYLGKVSNKTNSLFKSDSWSVKPLAPKTVFIAEKVKDEIKEKANDEVVGFTDEANNSAGNGESKAQPNASQAETATPAEEKKRRF